jgi:hypothetical protein
MKTTFNKLLFDILIGERVYLYKVTLEKSNLIYYLSEPKDFPLNIRKKVIGKITEVEVDYLGYEGDLIRIWFEAEDGSEIPIIVNSLTEEFEIVKRVKD